MSKKPKEGNTVQISGRLYEVIIAPELDGDWYRIEICPRDATTTRTFLARSESWRSGCGPWKLYDPPFTPAERGGVE